MTALPALQNNEQPQLTERQLMVGNKMVQTKIKIFQAILATIKDSLVMTRETFIATLVDPNQAEIRKLDERASLFFKKMMEGVNQQMNPFYDSLQVMLLKKITEEKVIALPQDNAPMIKEFIEASAFPFVRELMNEFDSIDESIVKGFTGL